MLLLYKLMQQIFMTISLDKIFLGEIVLITQAGGIILISHHSSSSLDSINNRPSIPMQDPVDHISHLL